MTPSELQSLSGMTAEEAADKATNKIGLFEYWQKEIYKQAYLLGRSDQAALDGQLSDENLRLLLDLARAGYYHNHPTFPVKKYTDAIMALEKFLESKQSGK